MGDKYTPIYGPAKDDVKNQVKYGVGKGTIASLASALMAAGYSGNELIQAMRSLSGFSTGGSVENDMTENEQRRFGITENLLKTKVPTHYGAGEHKVKLAYITEPEAKLLEELDLYDSNPPHEGPGGIPNYNDSGGTAGGARAGGGR